MHQRTKSLSAKGSPLSDTSFQLKVLNRPELASVGLPDFQECLRKHSLYPLYARGIEILQVNVGKLCNQTCAHCHVDAGPERKREVMSQELLSRCVDIVKNTPSIHTVDITGGAPEMNPYFKWFVEQISTIGKKIINRSNLTILVSGKKYEDLPDFFACHRVNVVSSLPHFSKNRTDAQRGEGVFESSIEALRRLNKVGYGLADSGLELDLVYNPTGAFLPGNQSALESEFRRNLQQRYGIAFNRLFTITNLPISRFLEYLLDSGNYLSYMETLINAFNPATVSGLMCRNTLSVGWEGYLYDCDFNQMLDLKVMPDNARHINDFDYQVLAKRQIVVNRHCFGCTAGAGSSCGGSLI